MKRTMWNLTGALLVGAAGLATPQPQSAAPELHLSNIRAQQPGQASECCSVVMKALEAMSRIQKNMVRVDVEKEFAADGGIDFGSETIYAYKLCPYIMVRVKFLPNRTVDAPGGSHAHDVVQSISKPYIEYPASD